MKQQHSPVCLFDKLSSTFCLERLAEQAALAWSPLAWAGTKTAGRSRTPEGLSAPVFMWAGSLVSERGTERHVPKEITNISTRAFLGFVSHQFRA